tara:strand:- start:1151 stop:3223 length:2073 start_codon:yes stop_codon:yes gene_type:complete
MINLNQNMNKSILVATITILLTTCNSQISTTNLSPEKTPTSPHNIQVTSNQPIDTSHQDSQNNSNKSTASSTHEENDVSKPIDIPNIVLQTNIDKISNMYVPSNNLREIAIRILGKDSIPVTIEPRKYEYQIDDEISFNITNLDTDLNSTIIAKLLYIGQETYFFVPTYFDLTSNNKALNILMSDFENNILPTVRKSFGQEWSPGIDSDKKIYILYADGLGNSVGGYYSRNDQYSQLAHKYSNEKEMFYINADTIDLDSQYIRSVLAHEFQHMIHWANDPNEETWMNEGASMLAEMMSGYTPINIAEVFLSNPDVQLNTWSSLNSGNESIQHYGASFLFMNYFLNRFGQELTRQLIEHADNGFSSIDQILAQQQILNINTGKTITSLDLFGDWLVANYIGDTKWLNGLYGYENLPNIPTIKPKYKIDCYSTYLKSNVHQYGADYIENICPQVTTVQFTGSKTIGVADVKPHSGNYMFWGNRQDGSDTILTKKFDLSSVSTATLNYWAWWNLENNYDYAYLLISTDNGQNWEIIETPNGTNTNISGNNLGWGYNNNSGGGQTPIWIRESIDISSFAGKQILLRFEYITDAAVNSPGIFIDDISIEEINYKEDFENGHGDWQSNGWVRLDNMLPQNWLIKLVNREQQSIQTIPVKDGSTEFEILSGSDIIISPTTPYTTEIAYYELKTYNQK